MMTTKETVTDGQIRALRSEALSHGDDDMADICGIALGEPSRHASLNAQYSQERARARAAEVIAYAEGEAS